MVSYANKRKLGEKPPSGIRNRNRSVGWYQQRAEGSIVEGAAGSRLLARVLGSRAMLDYEFPDVNAMRESFPGLWSRLDPRLKEAGAQSHVFIDYEDARNRRWIEPILVGQLFASADDYVIFEKRDALAAGELAYAAEGTELRPFVAGDEETLIAAAQAGFPHAELSPETLATEIAEAQWALVAETEGVAVGYCALSDSDGAAWVDSLIVDERHRGKGLGEALLLSALGWARDSRQGHPVRLYTDFFRKEAIGLYKKHGFRQLYTGVQFKRPLDPAAIEAIMSKRHNTYTKWVGFR